jgi:hypothetical protein
MSVRKRTQTDAVCNARVVQDPEKPVEKPILAEAIRDIGAAARKLAASGVNKKGVIVLLQHETKLAQRDIKLVLDALPQLERMFCR